MKSTGRKLSVSLLVVLAVGIFALTQHDRVLAATTNITINGNGTGRAFDGVGAISGGGATSRLLINYPEPQRSQILDYLFKPNYGASLQILKVEIGGDGNSTEGAEPSHQHTASDENYNRGYEWWLMEQAKQRNPNIQIAALEWTAPGWINGGICSQDNANYVVRWLQHAQSDHNVAVNYIGIWNETSCGSTQNPYIKTLRNTLNTNNLSSVQIVAPDLFDWNLVGAMQSDATLASDVYAVTDHYPSRSFSSYPTTGQQNTGYRLWATEDGPWNNTDYQSIAGELNQNYIKGKLTATVIWNLITSYYDNLDIPNGGLMTAKQPWSGYYSVDADIWAMAHTTQFTQIGWHYIDSASALLPSGGSYVTLKAPNNQDWSTVIETGGASANQTLNFSVTGGLSAGTFHVWRTDANASFQQLTDITPTNGSFSITAEPHAIYTITTTTGQSKGAITGSIPAAADLTLPYTDDFESYAVGNTTPNYFIEQNGAYEIQSCADGRSGSCMAQVVDTLPHLWGSGTTTLDFSELGSQNWTDYTVKADFDLQEGGAVNLEGRLGQVVEDGSVIDGYRLYVQDNGTWQLTKGGAKTQLATGNVSFGTHSWHTLQLSFAGTTITASIDGTQVANVTDSTYTQGMVALGSGFTKAQFDNLSIQPANGGGNATTIDDSVQGTGTNQFNYVGNWGHCGNGGCGNDPTLYNGTNSWSSTTDDTVTLQFTGTQLQFYGVVDPGHGIGAVSIDGGSETTIDFYAANRQGNQLLWTSPTLSAGTHTFKLRVTGTKNGSSSGVYVTVDRVVVTTNSTTTTDDSVQGTGTNQFNYAGSWGHCGGGSCGNDPTLYNGTNSWSNTTNDSVTFQFTGTKIQFYGVVDPGHGIGAFSIDGGGETNIDFYAASRQGNRLLWTSPTLSAGSHTLKLRVTGTKNGSSSGYYMTVDRVVVTS